MITKATSPSLKISALLADDQEIYLTGLVRSMRNLKFVSKICSARNEEEILTLINIVQFNVIILSMDIPDINNTSLIQLIREKNPDAKIIGFSATTDAKRILSCVNDGCHGFFLKNTTRAEIKDALFDVMTGNIYISNSAQKIIEADHIDENLFSSGKLTIFKSDRMKELLILICQEYTIKEIAHKLNVAEKTIEKNRAELMRATGAKNAVGLALYALKNKLIDESSVKM